MSLRAAARRLKADALTLWLAARDPEVPWLAKIVAALTAAYAFSPIDLVPDFIPVLGLLDDLLIVPAGVWLAMRFIPAPVVERLRRDAALLAEKPVSRAGLVMVIAIWALAALAIWSVAFRR